MKITKEEYDKLCSIINQEVAKLKVTIYNSMVREHVPVKMRSSELRGKIGSNRSLVFSEKDYNQDSSSLVEALKGPAIYAPLSPYLNIEKLKSDFDDNIHHFDMWVTTWKGEKKQFADLTFQSVYELMKWFKGDNHPKYYPHTKDEIVITDLLNGERFQVVVDDYDYRIRKIGRVLIHPGVYRNL